MHAAVGCSMLDVCIGSRARARARAGLLTNASALAFAAVARTWQATQCFLAAKPSFQLFAVAIAVAFAAAAATTSDPRRSCSCRATLYTGLGGWVARLRRVGS